eukprot:s158_g28.t1
MLPILYCTFYLFCFLFSPFRHEDCSSVKTFDGVTDVLEEQKPAAFILENVDMELQIPTQLRLQAELLYPSDHARVTSELMRLEGKRLKSKAKQPEDEAICFTEAFNQERAARGEAVTEYVDISQTVTRMAQATGESKALPSCQHFFLEQNFGVCLCVDGSSAAQPKLDVALLTDAGSEMMRFQGLHVEDFPSEVKEPEKLLADLAGNAFSACCISAAIFALLASLQYESDSEDEQLAAISQAFSAVGVMSRMAKES